LGFVYFLHLFLAVLNSVDQASNMYYLKNSSLRWRTLCRMDCLLIEWCGSGLPSAVSQPPAAAEASRHADDMDVVVSSSSGFDSSSIIEERSAQPPSTADDRLPPVKPPCNSKH